MFERPPRPGEPARPGGKRPPGPPRPPGSGPPRPPGAAGRRPPAPGESSQRPPRSRSRPGAPGTKPQSPLAPGILMLAAAAIATSLLFFFESSPSNAAGSLVGAFLGPVLLGWFLADDNARRAAGRYGDWPLLPARRLAQAVCALGWLCGGFHVYFLAQELTR